MKNYKNITLGVLNHNDDVYKKYIRSSLELVKNQCEIIIIKNLNPADAYNEILKKSKNDLIVLLHCDVSFSYDFIDIIKKSIEFYPDFGAFGILGVKKPFLRKKKYIFANSKIIQDVSTLEPSCIVINRKHGLKFDNKIFDEYHHIIEDYCCQISFQLSLKIYTLLINTYIPDNDKFDKSVLKNKYFVHYNNTFSQKGARWGSWEVYKRKLDQKWKRKVITT